MSISSKIKRIFEKRHCPATVQAAESPDSPPCDQSAKVPSWYKAIAPICSTAYLSLAPPTNNFFRSALLLLQTLLRPSSFHPFHPPSYFVSCCRHDHFILVRVLACLLKFLMGAELLWQVRLCVAPPHFFSTPIIIQPSIASYITTCPKLWSSALHVLVSWGFFWASRRWDLRWC